VRTVGIIQARMNSTRLPGKVLYELAGLPMISFMIERVKRTTGIDAIVLATGDGPENDALEAIGSRLGIQVFRGAEDDVLSRFLGAAKASDAEIVVRLTGDCPLADPDVISAVLKHREEHSLDYCCNVKPPSWPDGLDVSAFTFEILSLAAAEARLRSEREHVVPWMWKESSLEDGHRFRAGNVPAPFDMSGARWTVDDARDYLMLRSLAETMGNAGLLNAGWSEIMDCTNRFPHIAELNAGIARDEGLARSRAADQLEGR